jgi:hypothetical protein
VAASGFRTADMNRSTKEPHAGRKPVRFGVLLLLLTAFGLGSLAGPAAATSVDSGNGRGFSVRPATLSGWTLGVHEVLGGRSNNPPVGYNPGGSFGRINWLRWRKGFAIGHGTLWVNSCSPSCGSGRWRASGRIKVRLYRADNGSFKRMRFSRIKGPRNTVIFAYRGAQPPQWRIIKRFRTIRPLTAAGTGKPTSEADGPGSARASKQCGTVKGTGPWSGATASTSVARGPVSCRVARAVARGLFSARAKQNNSCGYSYCSYRIVRVYGTVWRGDVQMGAWIMHRCRKVSGCGRVLRGTFR